MKTFNFEIIYKIKNDGSTSAKLKCPNECGILEILSSLESAKDSLIEVCKIKDVSIEAIQNGLTIGDLKD
jgi:hypothetical protein